MTTLAHSIDCALARAARSYESAKRHLTERIGLGDDTIRLADAVVALAEYEGAFHLWRNISEVVPTLDADRIPKYLLMLATASPDDTWSGRTNDVRRAYAEGKRSAVQDARGLLNLT